MAEIASPEAGRVAQALTYATHKQWCPAGRLAEEGAGECGCGLAALRPGSSEQVRADDFDAPRASPANSSVARILGPAARKDSVEDLAKLTRVLRRVRQRLERARREVIMANEAMTELALQQVRWSADFAVCPVIIAHLRLAEHRAKCVRLNAKRDLLRHRWKVAREVHRVTLLMHRIKRLPFRSCDLNPLSWVLADQADSLLRLLSTAREQPPALGCARRLRLGLDSEVTRAECAPPARR